MGGEQTRVVVPVTCFQWKVMLLLFSIVDRTVQKRINMRFGVNMGSGVIVILCYNTLTMQ